MVAIEINLVEPDDAHRALCAGSRRVPDSRSEEDLPRSAPGPRRFWIHDLRSVDSFGEKADAPIDLTQPTLVVLVVGVLAAIAVARGPRDDLCHGGAFPGEQEAQLVSEPLEAARRDVVLEPAVWFLRVRHADCDGNPESSQGGSLGRGFARDGRRAWRD